MALGFREHETARLMAIGGVSGSGKSPRARRLAPRIGAAALVWALCLALAELARSYVLTGFPWALIGHVWVGRASLQLAVWVWPHGRTLLSFLAVSL